MLKRTSLLALILIFLPVSICLYAQNQKFDGYKGLWFSAGQKQEYGYRYSGGVSTYTSHYRPAAIYSPEVKKTFFVYNGTTGGNEQHLLIMVSYYDHRLNIVPKPVLVFDKMGVREPNDGPSLAIDREGFLWIFMSGRLRTRPGFIFRSTQPYSVDSFEKITQKEMIAPQPWCLSENNISVLFSKFSDSLALYYSSTKDGRTWTEDQKIAKFGGHYHISGVSGKRIITAFNYWPEGDLTKRTNLYLLQSEDMGRTWNTIDNKTIEVPLNKKINEALIRNFEAEGKLVYLCDLNFDKDGNPAILVILSKNSNPGPQGGPKEWMVIKWKDNKWGFIKVCESDHNYDVGSLYINDEQWQIIGPTEPGPQIYRTGGEIALWISNDEGATWVKSHEITSNSKVNNSFVRRPINAHKEFYALWTDGNADELSHSYIYFTNQKCSSVWMLPYDMYDDSEKPVKIR